MSFRRRITIAAAAAVTVAVLLASAGAYLAVRGQLRGQVDDSLRRQTNSGNEPADLQRLRFRFSGALGPGPQAPRTNLGGPAAYLQLVSPTGQTLRPPGDTVALPVDARVIALASHGGRSYLRDADVADTHVRIGVSALPGGGAIEVARSLGEVDNVLGRLRIILLIVSLGGIALAALLGRIVAGAAVAPVRRLTDAAEHVAVTQDLSARIDVSGADELSRLASSFNTMLASLGESVAALDASVAAQRQLVADASHELRTPLTSLRTNIEVLEGSTELPPEERAALMRDVHEQIEELTALMADVIELARGDEPGADMGPLPLQSVVEECLTRARRNWPGMEITADLHESVVVGAPERLERAVNNLIDNALQWSTVPGPVEVAVAHGTVSVRDYGPGIPEADLPYVFDRFYRAPDARGRPGSGLGLAIVRQVALAHGGSVTATNEPGGGAQLRLRIPEDAGENGAGPPA